MTGKKSRKVLLVWLCIITLLMPFAQEVLAAALTGNESSTATVVLETVAYRQGGPESTGTHFSHYDESSYSYKVGDVSVLKIRQSSDTTFADTFYCVNAERSFSVFGDGYNYKKAADELLTIGNITTSFVIGTTETGISISGRSVGEINVQLILEKMGGGGHSTVAGVQITGKSIAEVKQELLAQIDEYFEETES